MSLPTFVRDSLTWKLLAAQFAVIVAGSATLAIVALVIGPRLFHRHVQDALGFVPLAVMQHLDEAFNEALWLSLGLGIAAATLTAVAVSWHVSARVVRPISDLAEVARGISEGDYETRVRVEGSDEVAVLGRAFNEMAASLASAEERRRQLLSDVAHELRTPLATIDAYLEGLADGVVEPSAETWQLLRSESRRLGRITEDLTKVSRAEERQLDLHLQRVGARELLVAAAGAAAPAYAAKDVAVHVSPGGGDDLHVRVDTDRLGEVLANLLVNALRHTPPGGAVTLTAEAADDNVLLSVTDTGDGLAPDDLERIFERFYRADPSRSRDQGGSGIGLAIARSLVEAHGGRLWAESPGKGQGARFLCRLPAA
jgi:two-component system sensor histidine kinase BaeS